MAERRRQIRIPLFLALVALGAGTALAAAQHKPGDLDHSFSGNGKAQVGLSQRPGCQGSSPGKRCNDYARSVAIDRRGRIVVGGITDKGSRTTAGIVRLRPNGELDDSFADVGSRQISGSGAELTTDSQNRIVVAPEEDFSADDAVRLTENGELDDSFGGDGRVSAPFGSAVAVDTQDRVLIAGAGYDPPKHSEGISLERYLADGSIDPSFADSSNVQVMDGSATRVNGMAIDGSKATFVVCSLTNFDDPDGGPGTGAIVEFLPNGGVDETFGDAGIVISSPKSGHEYDSIAIDNEGRIVAAGNGFVDRYLPGGTRDAAFSGDGRVSTTTGALRFGVAAVAVDDRNRVVAAGGDSLARFKANGKVDRSFGDGGTVDASFESPNAVALDRRGGIVTVGGRSHGRLMEDFDYAVARRYASP